MRRAVLSVENDIQEGAFGPGVGGVEDPPRCVYADTDAGWASIHDRPTKRCPTGRSNPDVPHAPAPPPHPAGRRRLRRRRDVRAHPPGRRSGPGRHTRHGHQGPRHGDADQRERRPGEPPAHGLQRSRHRLQHTRFGAGRVRVRPARRRGQVRRRQQRRLQRQRWRRLVPQRHVVAGQRERRGRRRPVHRRTGSGPVPRRSRQRHRQRRERVGLSATPRPSPPASSTSRRRRRSVSPDGDLISPPPAVLRRHRHPGCDDRRVPGIVAEERHPHRGEGGDR